MLIPASRPASPRAGLRAALLLTAAAIAFPHQTPAQSPIQSPTVPPAINDFEAALVGRWAGVLEYRDYQAPAGEDNPAKRVKLPTWAAISLTKAGYRVEYTYDDGPGKTVTENLDVTLTGTPVTYTAINSEKPADPSLFAVSGIEQLKNGRGTLLLTGKITENQKSVDARTTLTLRRNVLTIVKETRAPGQDFRFRDGYTLTRLTPFYDPSAGNQSK